MLPGTWWDCHGSPVQALGLDSMILVGLFQLGLVCDSMIFSQQWCPVCKSVQKCVLPPCLLVLPTSRSYICPTTR